jgi:MoaA/NifB/PqqE/SkfB family radical SAM enzyme
MLSEELSSEILKSGLDHPLFSFDGCDKETYEHIRNGGNFEKVVENITRFLEIKREKNKKIHHYNRSHRFRSSKQGWEFQSQ